MAEGFKGEKTPAEHPRQLLLQGCVRRTGIIYTFWCSTSHTEHFKAVDEFLVASVMSHKMGFKTQPHMSQKFAVCQSW